MTRLFKSLLVGVSATDGVSFAGTDGTARAGRAGGDLSPGAARGRESIRWQALRNE